MNLHAQTYDLELLTPAWVSGANPHSAEIRVSTLRGQLRFWMRRLYPSQSLDRATMGQAGNDGPTASHLHLRLSEWTGRIADQNLEDYTGKKGPDATSDPEGYFLWPLRPNKESQQKRAVIHPGAAGNATLKVEIQWRLLNSSQQREFIPALQNTWEAFSLLGAIGTRSTRGYGGVWPKGLNLRDASDFSSRLQFLPASVSVRLLEGKYGTAREAIAHAAKWFRALRLGTSRFGDTPSEWGRNDHDVALKPAQGSYLHRPILGLPLAQRYKDGASLKTKYEWRNPDTGKTEWNDRYPSPVRIKVIRVAGAYRAALVILRDQILPANTTLSIEERGGPSTRRSQVSLSLIDHIAQEGEAIH